MVEVIAGNLEQGKKIDPKALRDTFEYIDRKFVEENPFDFQQAQTEMKSKYQVNEASIDDLFDVLNQMDQDSCLKAHLLRHIEVYLVVKPEYLANGIE